MHRIPHNASMSLEFKPAETVHPRALKVLSRERARLRRVAPGSHLVLTGGSSLPGALTGGDVDLHLRVPGDVFPRVVEGLAGLYDVVHPEIWTATLATFAARDDGAVGIAVTPIDSEHDLRFRRAWVRLATDPAALEAYNALKRRHEGGDLDDYLAAKSRFFDAISGETRSG
jgi:GrpB-like predicted nucleotidyltransferase (UPF0157 family)